MGTMIKRKSKRKGPLLGLPQKISLLSEREQRIFFVCVFGVIVYGLYLGIYKPFSGRIANLDNQRQRKEVELRKALRNFENTKDVNERYVQYLGFLKQNEPDEEIMSSVFKEVEAVANQMRLRVVDLKPNKVKQKDKLNQFGISLIMEGSFIRIIEFVYELQAPKYLFKVENLHLERGFKKTGDLINAKISLSKILISVMAKNAYAQEEPLCAQVPAKKKSETPAIDVLKKSIVKIQPFDYYRESMEQRNLFQLPWEVPVQEIREVGTSLELSQQIKLVGVYLDNDPRAIVEDVKTQEIHFVSRGELIGAARLEEINESKAIFIYNGKKVELVL